MKAIILTVLLSIASVCAMAGAPKATPGAQALMSQYDRLNDQCRGGSGDNPSTISVCNQRDKLYPTIVKTGWCWGPDDVAGYEKKWIRCEKPAPTLNSANSVPIAISAPLPENERQKNIEINHQCAV